MVVCIMFTQQSFFFSLVFLFLFVFIIIILILNGILNWGNVHFQGIFHETLAWSSCNASQRYTENGQMKCNNNPVSIFSFLWDFVSDFEFFFFLFGFLFQRVCDPFSFSSIRNFHYIRNNMKSYRLNVTWCFCSKLSSFFLLFLRFVNRRFVYLHCERIWQGNKRQKNRVKCVHFIYFAYSFWRKIRDSDAFLSLGRIRFSLSNNSPCNLDILIHELSRRLLFLNNDDYVLRHCKQLCMEYYWN